MGGAESLPVFDRVLEQSEIDQINVSELEIGDSYPEPRIVHHSILELIWRDGELSFIDKWADLNNGQ